MIRSSLVWTPEVAGERDAAAARETMLRCSDAAALGLGRLTDAVAALGRVDAGTAELDGPVGSRLQEMARGLEAAARVHIGTMGELDGLLR